MFFIGCELSLPTGKIMCCLAMPLKAFIGTDVKTGQERLFVEATGDSPRWKMAFCEGFVPVVVCLSSLQQL